MSGASVAEERPAGEPDPRPQIGGAGGADLRVPTAWPALLMAVATLDCPPGRVPSAVMTPLVARKA